MRTFIDLFCGCGGFTLGLRRAGFDCLAAIDSSPEAVETLRANCPELPNVLEKNLQRFKPSALADLIHAKSVDVIVGGPPCQGFSTARQVDGANHGGRLIADPRRRLYRTFLRYVDFFQPRVFVMENVLGLRSAAGGAYFTAVQREARELGVSQGRAGYRVHAQVEDAWELGVPQKRRRQLIIGVRNDLAGYFPAELKPSGRVSARIPLWAAIGDLPTLSAGGGNNKQPYDEKRRARHLRKGGKSVREYLTNALEVQCSPILTNHVARPHSARDLRDFLRLREGESSAVAMRERKVKFEFPYDKSKFKDRYTRQSRSKPCSTIVAHLSKDGLMFIHPTQNRSLTPREAARIQSFPDWFLFPTARTHAFRLIGNAVPPLVAEAVGNEVMAFLMATGPQTEREPRSVVPRTSAFLLPPSLEVAIDRLLNLSHCNRYQLRALATDEFVAGWHSLLFLFPELHPDNALDHGGTLARTNLSWPAGPTVIRLLSRRYARSGWPVALRNVGREAWRRYEAGEVSSDAFYCVQAQRAGLDRRQWVYDASSAATLKGVAR